MPDKKVEDLKKKVKEAKRNAKKSKKSEEKKVRSAEKAHLLVMSKREKFQRLETDAAQRVANARECEGEAAERHLRIVRREEKNLEIAKNRSAQRTLKRRREKEKEEAKKLKNLKRQLAEKCTGEVYSSAKILDKLEKGEIGLQSCGLSRGTCDEVKRGNKVIFNDTSRKAITAYLREKGNTSSDSDEGEDDDGSSESEDETNDETGEEDEENSEESEYSDDESGPAPMKMVRVSALTA